MEVELELLAPCRERMSMGRVNQGADKASFYALSLEPSERRRRCHSLHKDTPPDLGTWKVSAHFYLGGRSRRSPAHQCNL